MDTYDARIDSPSPFWFASEELLTAFLRIEAGRVGQLLAKHPDFRGLFDAPEATVPQRRACFALLAHRKVVDMIYDTFAARYQESPSLSDEESTALSHTYNLVAEDAPAWVLEVNEVVESLPYRIYNALPEPLRRGGFDENNSAQVTAVKTFSNVEQIRTLTEAVLDQQLRRLEKRWSVTLTTVVEVRIPNKPKARRTRDRKRMIRDKLIAEIDDVAETNSEFLGLMDERNVKPQPTWNDWPGSWVKAYENPRLRDLIHKDKSRALSRVRAGGRR